jgi:hypothetical protein
MYLYVKRLMEFRKEYFSSPYYFFLKEGKDDITLYFSVSNTLTEARKKDEILKFKKTQKNSLKKELSKIKKEKNIKNTSDLKKHLSDKKEELEELVDYDGTMLSSKIPIFNPYLSPKKTTDQEVVATRQTNNPVTRGYRVYWGESVDNEDSVIKEIDFSDAFGYEEVEDAKTYNQAANIMKKMGVEDDLELDDRLSKFGFSKKLDKSLEKQKKNGKCLNCFTKRRLTEKEKIEEHRKNEVVKMVEDIILNKKKKEDKITPKKQKGITKILSKNIENIKKIADKEGVDIMDLIKLMKK